jgi:hypothetical protein
MDDAFDLVYWDGMGKVMDEFPKTFQDWVTHHISSLVTPPRTMTATVVEPKMRTPHTSPAAVIPFAQNYTEKTSPTAHGSYLTTHHKISPTFSPTISSAATNFS